MSIIISTAAATAAAEASQWGTPLSGDSARRTVAPTAALSICPPMKLTG